MIKEKEKKILFEWFAKKKIKIKENDNFLTKSIIDSFDMIELIQFIEKKFDIKFKPEDYQDPNFASIRKIAKLINKYHG